MASKWTSVGSALVADAILAQLACFIGVGTGTTAPDVGDTDLAIPATEARQSASESQPTAPVNQYQATTTADGTKTYGEVGIFDEAGSGSPPSGGNLLARAVLDVADRPNVNSGDTVTWTLQATIADNS